MFESQWKPAGGICDLPEGTALFDNLSSFATARIAIRIHALERAKEKEKREKERETKGEKKGAMESLALTVRALVASLLIASASGNSAPLVNCTPGAQM